jgi:hypothetical protein
LFSNCHLSQRPPRPARVKKSGERRRVFLARVRQCSQNGWEAIAVTHRPGPSRVPPGGRTRSGRPEHVALEELVRARCELLVFTTLDKMVAAIRTEMHDGDLRAVVDALVGELDI